MKRFKEFLLEMEQLPSFITNKFGKYIDMNAKARERRSSGIKYQDDKRYNDHQGALWLNVKHKDYNTIAAAVLTGMADTHKIPNNVMPQFDKIVSSEEFTNEFLENNQRAKMLVDSIWAFLKKYMSKGTVTVYRGIELTDTTEKLIKSTPYLLYSPVKLVQYFDNTTKEFNSFSTNINVAKDFAQESRRSNYGYIVFSAEVDNNDVNWAFTAYLMGRHGTVSEQELNINNLKRLKNVKVISYKIGYNDIRHVLKLVSEPIKQAFKHASGLEAWEQLYQLFKDNRNVKFDKNTRYNKAIDTKDNWNILRLLYDFSEQDVELEFDIGTPLYLAYNTKSQQLLYGENVFFHKNSLVVRTGNARAGSLYCDDSARPVFSFTDFKPVDEDMYTRDCPVVAFKLQNNMWRLFNCETCEFTNNEEYTNIITPSEVDQSESAKILYDNDIDVTINDSVFCVNDENKIEAVYYKDNNYSQTIPDAVLHSKSKICDTCTVKGKQAFYVIRNEDMHLSYVANGKIVDENNTVLVNRVKSVDEHKFAVVETENSEKHACKLLNLNTMRFVSDVEFYDLYPVDSNLEKLMDKFVIITDIDDDGENIFNILINTGGEKYKLGLAEWAVYLRDLSNKPKQKPLILFEMDNGEYITYDITSGTLT